MKLRIGSKMVKLKNLSDKESKMVIEEVLKFKELVHGHEDLLRAIGRL